MKHTSALQVPLILAFLLVGWPTIPNILADAQQPAPSQESEDFQPAGTADPEAADAASTGEGTKHPAAHKAAPQDSDGETDPASPAPQDVPNHNTPAKDTPAEAEQVLNSENAKLNYTVGHSFGQDVRQKIQPILSLFEFDLEMFLRGFRDAFEDESLLTEEQMHEVRTELDQEFRRKQQQLMSELAEKNKREGEAFLAANKKEQGVKTSNSGLQYKVLKAGKGRRPTIASRVRVHYRGTFVDGTEFDSSYKRGEPVEFAVSDVIKGWSEALQMMPAGSRWKLFIPAKLAYGEQGRPPIGPNTTLVFEVELLEVLE